MPKDFEFDVGISVEEIRGDFEFLDESFRQMGGLVEQTASAFLHMERRSTELGVSMRDLAGISSDTEETYRNFISTFTAGDQTVGATIKTFESLASALDVVGTSFGNALSAAADALDRPENAALKELLKEEQLQLAGEPGAGDTPSASFRQRVIETKKSIRRGIEAGVTVATEFFGGAFQDDPRSPFGKAASRPTREEKAAENKLEDDRIALINKETVALEAQARAIAGGERAKIKGREFERFARVERRELLAAQLREIDEQADARTGALDRAGSRLAFIESQRQELLDPNRLTIRDFIQRGIARRQFDIRQQEALTRGTAQDAIREQAGEQKRNLQRAFEADEATIKNEKATQQVNKWLEAILMELRENKEEKLLGVVEKVDG